MTTGPGRRERERERETSGARAVAPESTRGVVDGGVVRVDVRGVGGDDDVSNETTRGRRQRWEWDGKTYAGSRLEYAGVEARGELRWPIPLHALAEVNPDLKALLEVTRTSDGEEERKIANRLSVVESDADGGEGRREGAAFGVVSTSSSSRAGVSGCHSKCPGLAQFEQRLHETGGASTSSGEPRRRLFETLVLEAKKKTPLKMKIDDAPLSKTMLSKVRVRDSRRGARARSRGLDARREEEG